MLPSDTILKIETSFDKQFRLNDDDAEGLCKNLMALEEDMAGYVSDQIFQAAYEISHESYFSPGGNARVAALGMITGNVAVEMTDAMMYHCSSVSADLVAAGFDAETGKFAENEEGVFDMYRVHTGIHAMKLQVDMLVKYREYEEKLLKK